MKRCKTHKISKIDKTSTNSSGDWKMLLYFLAQIHRHVAQRMSVRVGNGNGL